MLVASFHFSDVPSCCESVHHWHLDIHEYDLVVGQSLLLTVRALARTTQFLFDGINSLQSVVCLIRFNFKLLL